MPEVELELAPEPVVDHVLADGRRARSVEHVPAVVRVVEDEGTDRHGEARDSEAARALGPRDVEHDVPADVVCSPDATLLEDRSPCGTADDAGHVSVVAVERGEIG